MSVRPGSSDRNASKLRRLGWMWVVAQFFLVGVWIVLLRPLEIKPLASNGIAPAVRIVGAVIGAAGAVYSLLAALWLGKRLTPLPVPRAGSDLVATGPYRRVRHPIYGGLILLIWGATLYVFRPAPVVATVAIPVFFLAKSRFEERQLKSAFPDYAAFASRRYRFIPWIW